MKTQISTSVPPIIRDFANELVETQYGTMSALLTALISTAYAKYQQEGKTMGGQLSPMAEIAILETKMCPIELNIRTANGTITQGYTLEVKMERNGAQITVDALNLCVTEEQTSNWCIKQCANLAGRLAEKDRYTPGEIVRLLHCSYDPLSELGISTPPQQKQATMSEMREFHAKTGQGMVYIQNDLYREWAVAYNQWIREHPEEAADFGCTFQDEEWIPVK